jgi:hypothetical protein
MITGFDETHERQPVYRYTYNNMSERVRASCVQNSNGSFFCDLKFLSRGRLSAHLSDRRHDNIVIYSLSVLLHWSPFELPSYCILSRYDFVLRIKARVHTRLYPVQNCSTNRTRVQSVVDNQLAKLARPHLLYDLKSSPTSEHRRARRRRGGVESRVRILPQQDPRSRNAAQHRK